MSATTSLADTHQSSNYQQGRLLLLIAGRRLWSPSGQTSVRPQRRRTLRFLRKAFWTHHAAPARSPLVARPWADTVPSLCSGLPLSQWHSSVLLRRQHLPGSRRRGPPSPALVSHYNCNRPACQTIDLGRPIISCHRSTGVEQTTISRPCFTVTYHLATRTENISVSLEFCRLLVTNALFPVISRSLIDCVKCPCNVLRDSVT